eukprot:gene11002-12165_t
MAAALAFSNSRFMLLYVFLWTLVCLSLVVNAKRRSTLVKDNSKICHSKKCRRVAEKILANMDPKTDPCDNFYQHACGSWIKNHNIPKGKDEFSAIVELSENNDMHLKKLLKSDETGDIETVKKVKNFYKSCLNTKLIDERGSKPLEKFIKKLGSWDMFNDFDEDNWDFNKTLQKFHKEYPAEIFFTVDVDVDPKNRSMNIITIDQAKLCLPQIAYYVNRDSMLELQKYAASICSYLGISYESAKEKMAKVINFEQVLAKQSVAKPAKRYARSTIKALAEAIPEFPWLEHIRYVLSPREIKEDDHIVVLSNDYLADLIRILNATPKSILSNYMMWRMVKDMVPFLSSNFTNSYQRFKNHLTGKTHNKSREEICFRYTDEILGPLVGGLFIRHEFSVGDKNEVEEMMKLIIEAFEDNAETVPWISGQTIKAVKEKADAAVIKVGYPDYLYDDKLFNERYKEIVIHPDTFFENVESIDTFSNRRTFRKLDKPVDPHQWVSVPHMANAFYVVTKNEIVIPAGILQPPFFYGEPIPRSVSYGAVGHVLGHELTHGFDTLGRKFNLYGELIQKRTKWSDPSVANFEERTKCLVDQFNRFKIGKDLHIDGKNTLGENIADGGGLKIAFKAYEDWVKKNGEEYRLPGLKQNNKQLFFLGYAQKECHNSTHHALVESIKDDVHAPSMFRIIGTLSNTEAFAKAFNCPAGSRMNPKEKCHVW